MSISNEALQKLAREIEAQAASAQQQIGIARTQIAGKQREQRLVKLTLSELNSLPEETVVYEGVGKMFAALPVSEMTQKLEDQTKGLDSEVEKLGQRLVYLETTHKNSREHIEQMLRKT
ncbi:prefoldin subunit 1 [Cordyceps militaris CM01]|uniref:Prefoldin subunit 1 n=2 Tax=Cordyceps militaris TaxID=73501 RepID=G3JN90_CORMM|nr:prefoldin subunit 1 [Cordyceps militaris CM01]ATY62000.1 prefoldin subunit 1 [Cordyceps militaris]EGX90272.1 prefoldin subunit 1 [Cordyceps militaris CM01]